MTNLQTELPPTARKLLVAHVATLVVPPDRLRAAMLGPQGAAMRMFRLSHAFVAGDPAAIGLELGDARLVLAESLPYPDRAAALAEECRTAIEAEAGETIASACALNRLWAGNIWHWFTESVPIAAAQEAAGFDGVYLVPPGLPMLAQSLQVLGIAANRIRPHDGQRLNVNTLHFTEAFNGHELHRWPWLLDFIRHRAAALDNDVQGPRRVYIGRRGDRRRVFNEAEVVARLRRYGFTFIYMEDHPIDQQMRLLRDADIVVAPHGAGVVYTMFMRRGGTLIELFHAQYINACMSAVCRVLDIDYRMIVSQVNPAGNFPNDDLIRVPLDLLDLTLQRVLGAPDAPPAPAEIAAPSPPPAATPRAAAATGASSTSMEKLQHFTKFLGHCQKVSPYAGFDESAVPIDTQGFQSPDNARFFADIFDGFRPLSLLELGSWKGTSAIMFARHMLAYCATPAIGCIDTWLGSIEHWNNPEWLEQLAIRNGFPRLYERFLANVMRAGVAECITPLPMTTRTGTALARLHNVRPDAIYVDASHEYAEVLEDLHGVWPLIDDSGIIIADDFFAPEVNRAIREFCAADGVFGLYNANSPWPEALIVRNAAMRDRALACHEPLRPVPLPGAPA